MIPIKGNVHIPVGLKTDPRFILPDEAVSITAAHFNLLNHTIRGIDPMCGVGTFPRVINTGGGICDGIEIDPQQYALAVAEVPRGTMVLCADCRTVIPEKIPEKRYDYIFTSMPFAWFKQIPCGLDDSFAQTFKRMLKPGGFLLLDTLEDVQRENGTWNAAASQREYFGRYGFELGESLRFKAEIQHDTGEFMVMKLVLR